MPSYIRWHVILHSMTCHFECIKICFRQFPARTEVPCRMTLILNALKSLNTFQTGLEYSLYSSISTRGVIHFNSPNYNFYHPSTVIVYFGIADSGGWKGGEGGERGDGRGNRGGKGEFGRGI